VGGTVEPDNDSLVVGPTEEATFQRVLGNGRALFAGTPEACQL
jgi:hypothetical protein